MSNWDLGVVTDAGVTILNKIEAGLASAVIDTIVIGSGVYSTSEKALISRRTALKNQQLSATINATRFPDSSTLEIKASIDNTTVVSGFDITECGVYATVTEGGVTSTALFAVAYTETPDYMTAYNGEYPQIVIEDVYLPISNTASITVTVAPGAYALAEDLTDHEAEKATTADYGHTKIIDALTSASYADGEALAAHQGNVIKIELDKAYKSDDSASTDLVDGDYIPFYDTSATTKKKALWSTIIAKLKNIFPMGSTLAPIANGPKYPGTWSAGKQFVYQGLLYKTKVNVTSSDNINVGTGGNAELASDITSQISNLDNMYDGKSPSQIGDLNTPLSLSSGQFAINRFPSTATNKPSGEDGNGTIMTWVSTTNTYGAQMILGNNLYHRTNNNGTISDWLNLSKAIINESVLELTSNLNNTLKKGGSTFSINRFAGNTSNAPNTGAGCVITWSSSNNYGAQIAFNDGGLYYRKNSGGTISSWQTLSS